MIVQLLLLILVCVAGGFVYWYSGIYPAITLTFPVLTFFAIETMLWSFVALWIVFMLYSLYFLSERIVDLYGVKVRG